MIKNWITISWRNITRHITTFILNTSGLALAITGSIVLFILIIHLTSYDTFHEKADRTYRLVRETISEPESNGGYYHTPGIPNPLPDAFREDFPEITESTFINHKYQGILIGIDDPVQGMRYIEQTDGIGITENSFFRIFDRKLIRGNKEKILQGPNELVISEKMAEMLFPYGSALGKQVEVDKENLMTITGIMENHPNNTDFPFEIFISYPTVRDDFVAQGWNSTSSSDQFYFVIPEELTVSEVEKRLEDLKNKYVQKADAEQMIFHAQPLSKLHFDPRYQNFNYRSVEMSNLYIMGVIGLFLIITGCINYINLSTAVAMRRAKEVGIRKVLGGNRGVIIKQFLSETFIITLIAVLMSLGLAEILLVFVNQLLDLELSLNILSNSALWIYLLVLIVAVTLLAGLYPAFVLSGFNPSKVLKKIISNKSSSGYQLRRALVVFQFVISQFFIIGTVILLMQMEFISNRDLGFTTEAIMNIVLPERDVNKAAVIQQLINSQSDVEMVSLSGTSPASGSINLTDFEYDGVNHLTMMKSGDENYITLFDIQLLAGQSIRQGDTLTQVLANEEFVKILGFRSLQDAVGTQITIWDRNLTIVGVVNNFHAMSLKEKIMPLLIYSSKSNYQTLSVKIASNNLNESIGSISDLYKEVYPEYSFDYEFFDDGIASFYEGEKRMASIISLFSGFAIIIGCIGLYGLISYTTQQKLKEVGIRKVLGASIANIVSIFSKEIIVLVIIAFAIAAPLVAYGMNEWLNNFQYRIELDWKVFITGIGTTLFIALITVGYKTYKAAVSNPVESLINE